MRRQVLPDAKKVKIGSVPSDSFPKSTMIGHYQPSINCLLNFLLPRCFCGDKCYLLQKIGQNQIRKLPLAVFVFCCPCCIQCFMLPRGVHQRLQKVIIRSVTSVSFLCLVFSLLLRDVEKKSKLDPLSLEVAPVAARVSCCHEACSGASKVMTPIASCCSVFFLLLRKGQNWIRYLGKLLVDVSFSCCFKMWRLESKFDPLH